MVRIDRVMKAKTALLENATVARHQDVTQVRTAILDLDSVAVPEDQHVIKARSATLDLENVAVAQDQHVI